MNISKKWETNRFRFPRFLLWFFLFSIPFCGVAQSVFTKEKTPDCFTFLENGKTPPVFVYDNDYSGVKKIASIFLEDMQLVGGEKSILQSGKISNQKEIVIVGTLGKSGYINELIKSGKLNIENIKDKWDAYSIQVVEKPFENVDKALVVVGANKRGTIYGMFTLSEQMGVSPWTWWADVPVQKVEKLYINKGTNYCDAPKIQYRGIFLNDEAPALSGWTGQFFGGFTSKFYEKVFILLLRMKANYLWPAMWGNAFNDDDKQNPVLADELGIVMGSSHHEPMLRAQQEWKRYGKGKWDYNTNQAVLDSFWHKGIVNMGSHESLITIGMRGDGDEPMSEESNIALLEKIVKNQRKILEEVTGKKANEIPQLWALYKEVQDYYDKGMRVPDDVTLLLCDDNWGNVRRVPKPTEKLHPGGYGMYYHFDYVGDPRNYKWLNTNQISRIWEQMNLCYEHQIKKIWIVNVGDLKPMEFPIQFFLDMAWNPEKMTVEEMSVYTKRWANQQFTEKYGSRIEPLLQGYTKLNSFRKPELLNQKTYSIQNYRESENISSQWKNLEKEALLLEKEIPENMRDAFFQLVLHPILACHNLHELYRCTALNYLYAEQNRFLTNNMADSVKILYKNDSLISYRYNHLLANGKWNHFMDQTHIGYTYWQQPLQNSIPHLVSYSPQNEAKMGVALEGSEKYFPAENPLEYSLLTNYGSEGFCFEVFNQGIGSFDVKIKTSEKCIIVDKTSAQISTQERFFVKIDFSKVPKGFQSGKVEIDGGKLGIATISVKINNQAKLLKNASGFIEADGIVAINAENAKKFHANNGRQWKIIPEIGKSEKGITVLPTTKQGNEKVENNNYVEYELFFINRGQFKLKLYTSPTLDFYHQGGLRCAVSIDNETPVLLTINTEMTHEYWQQSVSNNIVKTEIPITVSTEGKHALRFYQIDPGIVLQKIEIITGNEKESYLGAPQSRKK